MQEVLPQPPEAFEAYMDSHVQEATQEGEELARRLFSAAVLLNLNGLPYMVLGVVTIRVTI